MLQLYQYVVLLLLPDLRYRFLNPGLLCFYVYAPSFLSEYECYKPATTLGRK